MLGREGHRSRWSLSLDGEMPSSREFVLFVFESFSAWHIEDAQSVICVFKWLNTSKIKL